MKLALAISNFPVRHKYHQFVKMSANVIDCHLASIITNDILNAFDSISPSLLIAKLLAYGFSREAVTFFRSYLKRCKQNARINNTDSVFQILLSGVPQDSIFGFLLFNIFIDDLYLWVSKQTY